jgi:hypothetical protein
MKLARIIDALLLLDSSTYKFKNIVDAKHDALVIRNLIK